MPTTIYTDPTSLYSPAFESDADLSWEETFEYQATDRKIEGQGEIADYISKKPKTATLSARITGYAIDPLTYSPQKLVNTRDELEALADKRQLVLVVSELFVGQLAIVGCTITKDVDDGQSFKASLKFKRLEFTSTATAAVPNAVLKRMLTAKKAGPAAKKAADAGQKAKVGSSVYVKAAKGIGWIK